MTACPDKNYRAVPADRFERLLELVGKACRTAVVENDERSYELWTAVRSELLDAPSAPSTGAVPSGETPRTDALLREFEPADTARELDLARLGRQLEHELAAGHALNLDLTQQRAKLLDAAASSTRQTMPAPLTSAQLDAIESEARAGHPKRSANFIPADVAMALVQMARSALSARASTGPLTLDTDAQVFFYEQDHYYLSNFSAFSIVRGGLTFPTSEHAYQWEKFPHLPELQQAIVTAKSAHEAFKIAEANKERVRTDWPLVKVPTMRNILHIKADQHEYVSRKLDATDDRILIENSWRDDFWGWGLNRDGQNMLGELWMEIRAVRRRRSDGGNAS